MGGGGGFSEKIKAAGKCSFSKLKDDKFIIIRLWWCRLLVAFFQCQKMHSVFPIKCHQCTHGLINGVTAVILTDSLTNNLHTLPHLVSHLILTWHKVLLNLSPLSSRQPSVVAFGRPCRGFGVVISWQYGTQYTGEPVCLLPPRTVYNDGAAVLEPRALQQVYQRLKQRHGSQTPQPTLTGGWTDTYWLLVGVFGHRQVEVRWE